MLRRLLLLCLLLGLAGCMEGTKAEPLKRVSGSEVSHGSKLPESRQP